MWRKLLICFVLSSVFASCGTTTISIHDEYYAKLDDIRVNKQHELLRYMHFVENKASQIPADFLLRGLLPVNIVINLVAHGYKWRRGRDSNPRPQFPRVSA